LKIHPTAIGKCLSLATLVAVSLTLSPAVRAEQVTWIADSTTSLDAQIDGTILIGSQMTVDAASPSGLWNVDYNFCVGTDGTDSMGNTLYLLNSSGGSETYWTGGFFFECGWGDLSALPVYGGEYIDMNSFQGAPGSLWSGHSGISLSTDPDDSTMLDFSVSFLANGPELPNLGSHAPEVAPTFALLLLGAGGMILLGRSRRVRL
jgi:hypothetical protein